jgi:hypothetical protein
MIEDALPALGFDAFLNFETSESKLTLQDKSGDQSEFIPAYGILNLSKITKFEKLR